MKKKVWIIILIIIVLVLVIPIPTGVYRDGGTRTYTALTYKIVDWNHIFGADDVYNKLVIYPFPMNFLSINHLLDIEEKNFSNTDIHPEPPTVSPTYTDTYGQNTQYIRTDGYHEDIEYPKAVIIRSVEELNSYYEENKALYNLDRRTDIASDSTIGFLDACDRYDAAYFEDRILVLVLLEEGSGSNRHQVTNVCQSSQGKLEINITPIIPEVGTCDMALWHLFIEPAADVTIHDESDIVINWNDKMPSHTHSVISQPQTVENPFVGYCGNTWTTIYFDNSSKYTFMLGESVTLTDILLNLNYDPNKLCGCITDYTVDTEFHTGYEINLTERFARCDTGQADLTLEQVNHVTKIIEWAKGKAEQEAST